MRHARACIAPTFWRRHRDDPRHRLASRTSGSAQRSAVGIQGGSPVIHGLTGPEANSRAIRPGEPAHVGHHRKYAGWRGLCQGALTERFHIGSAARSTPGTATDSMATLPPSRPRSSYSPYSYLSASMGSWRLAFHAG